MRGEVALAAAGTGPTGARGQEPGHAGGRADDGGVAEELPACGLETGPLRLLGFLDRLIAQHQS